MQVNLLDAKEQFANLVEMLDTKKTDEVVLVYNGNPVIKMTRADVVATDNAPMKRRLGVAKGKFTIPEEFDEWDNDILEMFGGNVK